MSKYFHDSGELTVESMSDDELHIDEHFSIDKDDELVIEELPYLPDPELGPPGSNSIHDLLPSVEEYKASNMLGNVTGTTSNRRRTRNLSIAAGITLILAILVFVISAASKSENRPSTMTGRTVMIEDFLFDNHITSLPALRDITTPQHKAAAFVADGDALQLPLSAGSKFVERYILALLYYHFDGPNWNYKVQFLSGSDHCGWYDDFDTPAGERIRQGVICDEDGYVQELHLAWNNLRSTSGMPREIGYLSKLERLDMHYNEIGGYFSESFRHMPNLRHISMMKSGLFGTLPKWIGEMTQLTSLGLGDNLLRGEIPSSIAKLTNLQLLGLDGNRGFMGSIDPLKNLRNLEALYLENNVLTGNLHNLNMPNLIELDVSNNALDEWLPKELLNHPTLRVLDVNNNLMTGEFPDDLFENTVLEYFAAHSSGFVGTIPARVGFLSNLKHFDVSFNGLNGKIPDTITQMTNLRYIATSGNYFDEQPMLDLSKLTNLKDLAMKNNNLIGTIPDSIGELTSLQLLDLDANSLSGTIPTWISLLQNLEHLLVNRNELTGAIPAQLETIPRLQTLLLDGNSITGNADSICESDSINLTHFAADCYPGQNGERPEIECRCCTQCCADGDESCNNKAWTSTVDPVWEYGFARPKYTFNLQNAPTAYSKQAADDVSSDVAV